MRSIKRFPHKCPISKCHSSFASANELKKHLQIHNNDLRQCQYCAFRYVREDNYKIHLKVHGFRSSEPRYGLLGNMDHIQGCQRIDRHSKMNLSEIFGQKLVLCHMHKQLCARFLFLLGIFSHPRPYYIVQYKTEIRVILE